MYVSRNGKGKSLNLHYYSRQVTGSYHNVMWTTSTRLARHNAFLDLPIETTYQMLSDHPRLSNFCFIVTSTGALVTTYDGRLRHTVWPRRLLLPGHLEQCSSGEYGLHCRRQLKKQHRSGQAKRELDVLRLARVVCSSSWTLPYTHMSN